MILVTGANGQLGTELRYLLDERGEEYVAVDVAEMDITNAEKVDEVFAQVKPTLVYHCVTLQKWTSLMLKKLMKYLHK